MSSRESTADPSSAATFKCEYASCGKTFTRKDHLVRHQANHSSTNYHCLVCRRAFKRLDLLQRHEKRNICGDAVPRAGPSYRKRSRSDTSSPPPNLPLTTNPITFPAVNPTPVLPNEFFDLGDMDIFAGWGLDFVPTDPWLPKPHEHLAGPYNEPTINLEPTWNSILAPGSAERGQELLASAALVARLQLSAPEYDLTMANITEGFQLYWAHIAPSFPFVHRGTFLPEEAPTELLLMMVVTGTVSTSALAPRKDFRALVNRVRGLIVQQCGSEAPVTVLQTFCLCHVFDTWYGTQESLFVAQCMWPVMVAHSRKKGIGVVGAHAGEGEDQVWQNWAKGEERRRAAYCVLMIDTEISAFWNQHPSRQLSIFAHDLALPCPRSQWEALTAADWLRVREPPPPSPTINRGKRQAYLPGMHPEFTITAVPDGFSAALLSAMVAQAKLQFRVDVDNALSVQMVLLGLMGTAWDHRVKGNMGIKFKEGHKHWRKLTLDGLIHLRATWESATQHATQSAELRDMRDTFGISILSVLSDIPMLQATAGATTICGSTLGTKHIADARRRCKMWAKTDDAWTCLWQSARYLKQALFNDWGIYTSWAVFLTTIVLYAYAVSGNITDKFTSPSTNPARGANYLLDLILNSTSKPDLSEESIIDLLECVSEKLGSRERNDKDNAALLAKLAESLRQGETAAAIAAGIFAAGSDSDSSKGLKARAASSNVRGLTLGKSAMASPVQGGSIGSGRGSIDPARLSLVGGMGLGRDGQRGA